MSEGHFGAHLRRMRALYRERRDVLVEAVGRQLGDGLRLGPADAGLEVAAYLAPGLRTRDVLARTARLGLALLPLSRYALAGAGREGLLLGYAALTPAAIRAGVRALGRALRG
jgi:GntR family transcriptional regulator/MocR family aminotransferase